MHAFVSERRLSDSNPDSNHSGASSSSAECSACRQAWKSPPSSLGLTRQYKCSKCAVKVCAACRQFLQDSCPCGQDVTEHDIASALRSKGSFLVSVLSGECATEGGSGATGAGYSEVVEQAITSLRASLAESSVYCQINILTPTVTVQNQKSQTKTQTKKEVHSFASSGVIRTESSVMTGAAGLVDWLGIDERAAAKNPTAAEIAAHGSLEEYKFPYRGIPGMRDENRSTKDAKDGKDEKEIGKEKETLPALSLSEKHSPLLHLELWKSLMLVFDSIVSADDIQLLPLMLNPNITVDRSFPLHHHVQDAGKTLVVPVGSVRLRMKFLPSGLKLGKIKMSTVGAVGAAGAGMVNSFPSLSSLPSMPSSEHSSVADLTAANVRSGAATPTEVAVASSNNGNSTTDEKEKERERVDERKISEERGAGTRRLAEVGVAPVLTSAAVEMETTETKETSRGGDLTLSLSRPDQGAVEYVRNESAPQGLVSSNTSYINSNNNSTISVSDPDRGDSAKAKAKLITTAEEAMETTGLRRRGTKPKHDKRDERFDGDTDREREKEKKREDDDVVVQRRQRDMERERREREKELERQAVGKSSTATTCASQSATVAATGGERQGEEGDEYADIAGVTIQRKASSRLGILSGGIGNLSNFSVENVYTQFGAVGGIAHRWVDNLTSAVTGTTANDNDNTNAFDSDEHPDSDLRGGDGVDDGSGSGGMTDMGLKGGKEGLSDAQKLHLNNNSNSNKTKNTNNKKNMSILKMLQLYPSLRKPILTECVGRAYVHLEGLEIPAEMPAEMDPSLWDQSSGSFYITVSMSDADYEEKTPSTSYASFAGEFTQCIHMHTLINLNLNLYLYAYTRLLMHT